MTNGGRRGGRTFPLKGLKGIFRPNTGFHGDQARMNKIQKTEVSSKIESEGHL